ncbi:WD repeat domain-containing protein [Colletotrichum higginsianum]|nr:WD repeat domain-containing protein [Colletotrichum higginsianum]
MSGLFGSASSSSSSNTVGDLKQDIALSNPPEDSISDLAFSPAQNQASDFLAVASWDKKVRIYEIAQNGQSEGRHAYEHDGPVLNCDFSKDGTKVLSGGADKAVKACDLASQQTIKIGEHEQPVKCVRFFDSANGTMAVSGSWDKTVKYWDMRSPTPAATLTCQERVYSIDVRNDLLVIGTADRYINVVDLKNPTKFYKTLQSPLKWQTRVVSCFTDGAGFAIGSIEGRCAIQYVEDKDASTAGSDGTFHFWDKDAKHRLKGYPNVGGSITATTFNKNGSIFAYGISYDWSKGFQHNTQQYPIKVMLHPVQADECKPRPTMKKR